MTEAFKQRRDYVVRALNSLPGVSCLPGSGTFYAFADVSRAISALGCRDDGELRSFLLNEAGVAWCRLRLRRAGPHAPVVRLQHADTGAGAEPIARILIARVDAA